MHQMYEQLSLNPIITDSLHNVNSIFIACLSLFTLFRRHAWLRFYSCGAAAACQLTKKSVSNSNNMMMTMMIRK